MIPTVLILAEDAEFARAVVARWQSERMLPAFTLVSASAWSPSTAAYDLAVAGPATAECLTQPLKSFERSGCPVICVVRDAETRRALQDAFPQTLVLREDEGWLDVLILLAGEVFRRVEAQTRTRSAERESISNRRNATLGRYMLEMRHSLNNALTSLLGNAELLLLEPGALSSETRSQIETMHSMALRMHEVMQRFSSLETELKVTEKHQSQGENLPRSPVFVTTGD